MKRWCAVTVAAAAVAVMFAACQADGPKPGSFTVSDPQTFGNLSVYFVRADDQPGAQALMTLPEALAKGLLEVHEGGGVNDLIVQSAAPLPVLIHAGEILKGGSQDRLVQHDFLVPPNAKELAVPVFCVERGRWSQRGSEDDYYFSGASKMAANKDLKLAAKSSNSQPDVWAKVDTIQERLALMVGIAARDPLSGTSLQLTLENDIVESRVKEYTDALAPAIDRATAAVGFIFAVNGEISTADIYWNHELFRSLWPALLEAAATEAYMAGTHAKEVSAPKSSVVSQWLASVGARTGEIQSVNDLTTLKIVEDSVAAFYETRLGQGETWIHRNAIRK